MVRPRRRLAHPTGMTPALAAFALVAMLGQGANGVEPPCALLLLTRTAAPPGVALTRISMAQGQVRIFPVDSAHDNVAIVLPWGRGQSGDLAQLTEPRLRIAGRGRFFRASARLAVILTGDATLASVRPSNVNVGRHSRSSSAA